MSDGRFACCAAATDPVDVLELFLKGWTGSHSIRLQDLGRRSRDALPTSLRLFSTAPEFVDTLLAALLRGDVSDDKSLHIQRRSPALLHLIGPAFHRSRLGGVTFHLFLQKHPRGSFHSFS